MTAAPRQLSLSLPAYLREDDGGAVDPVGGRAKDSKARGGLESLWKGRWERLEVATRRREFEEHWRKRK